MDLLIGGQTTASAKFAVLNMTGSGTPTASISAGTGITGGAFLTAAGNLGTTNATDPYIRRKYDRKYHVISPRRY